jgi:hypothetical protein
MKWEREVEIVMKQKNLTPEDAVFAYRLITSVFVRAHHTFTLDAILFMF